MYCTQSDLTERYGDRELKELTDETSAVAISSSEVSVACDEASSEIDTYLASRYAVPLVSPPAIVKGWACVLARIRLWGDRASEGIRNEADDVRKLLKDIARGLAQLPGQPAETTASATAATVTTRTQIFTDCVLGKRVSLP